MSEKFGLDWKKYPSERMDCLIHVMSEYHARDNKPKKGNKLNSQK